MFAGAIESGSPFRLLVIGNRIGVVAKQNGMRECGSPGRAAVLEGETKPVEGAADIQSLAFTDKPPSAKLDFLAANTQPQILGTITDVEKRLMQIGDVLVG